MMASCRGSASLAYVKSPWGINGGPPSERLDPHVTHFRHRVHQRQLLPALIAVSYMRVEELGFLVGEVVLDPGEEEKVTVIVPSAPAASTPRTS